MNQQQQTRALPSFSGLSSVVNDARNYENSRSSGNGPERPTDTAPSSNNPQRRGRHASPTSETPNSRNTSGGGSSTKSDSSAGGLLLQDTLSPLLDEVDALYERSKEIVASLTGPGSQSTTTQEDVSARFLFFVSLSSVRRI